MESHNDSDWRFYNEKDERVASKAVSCSAFLQEIKQWRTKIFFVVIDLC